MANIGSFKKSGQEFQGEIVTLSLQTRGVRIVPEASRSNDNAPSHRVYVGRAEIGAEICAMTPDRSVVHQAVFEKDLLAGTHVVTGEDHRTGGIDDPIGDRWGVLIGLERQHDENAEAQDEREGDGAPPPR